MRAFDLLAKAEQDIRVASQPRYHFEMALLRWMHLRKLVPLTELMDQLGGGATDACDTRGRAGGSPSCRSGVAKNRSAARGRQFAHTSGLAVFAATRARRRRTVPLRSRHLARLRRLPMRLCRTSPESPCRR